MCKLYCAILHHTVYYLFSIICWHVSIYCVDNVMIWYWCNLILCPKCNVLYSSDILTKGRQVLWKHFWYKMTYTYTHTYIYNKVLWMRLCIIPHGNFRQQIKLGFHALQGFMSLALRLLLCGSWPCLSQCLGLSAA